MARRKVFEHRSAGLRIDAWHVNKGKEKEVYAKAECGSCGTENIYCDVQSRDPFIAELESRIKQRKTAMEIWNAETYIPPEFRKLQEHQTQSELEDQRKQAENEATNAFLKLAGGLIVLDWFFNELSK